MFKHLLILINLLAITNIWCQAQKLTITPSNWWTQMNTDQLVLVVENAPIGITNISVTNSDIEIIKHFPAANKSFHLIEINIPLNTKAHTANLIFKTAYSSPVSYPFKINARKERSTSQKLKASDAIYQLIPDRFCNANEKNDNITSYFEKTDRLNPTGIHGGDLEGIISKLDYIDKLGCTALEIMPITESNLMMNSYKRLASTNFYKVDRRLGSLKLYKQLVANCETKGLKFIQSFTLHQVGNKHPYFQNLIDADFFNSITYDFNSPSPDFNILTDPYSPESIKKLNRQVWNKPNFATLNQGNIHVRQILIQQLIWWIETAGLKNIKIEQAARNSPELIKELYSSLNKEYDDLTVILDNHSYNNQSIYWEELTHDIPTFITNYTYALVLSNSFSPYEDAGIGTKALYEQQLLIHPSNQLSTINMLDNHMLNRAFSNADNDNSQLLMMVGHLVSSPGLPSIYYGTEWQIKGLRSKGISNLSKDFPGGWKNDERNGFSGKGMSESQNHFYRQLSKLLNWRKNNPDIFVGKFIHIFPQSDIYAFIREHNEEAILVIVNNSENSTYRFKEDDYADILSPFKKCKDQLTDDIYLNFNDIIVRSKSIAILSLEK